ncbi:MAG: DUF167 domain-containing protein [Candidatus Aerophobetes bacterium]
MPKLQKADNEVIFEVRVEVRAGRSEIVGVQEDVLKIRINAPPAKGKANKVMVHFLARKLGVKNSGVEIILPYVLIPTPAYNEECPDIEHPSPQLI